MDANCENRSGMIPDILLALAVIILSANSLFLVTRLRKVEGDLKSFGFRVRSDPFLAALEQFTRDMGRLFHSDGLLIRTDADTPIHTELHDRPSA